MRDVEELAAEAKAIAEDQVGCDAYDIHLLEPEDWQRKAVDHAQDAWDQAVETLEERDDLTDDEVTALYSLDMLHPAPRGVAWLIYNNVKAAAKRG